MLLLKPQYRSRSLVQISQLSLSLRIQICQLHTRTYVRLLGPCFKTGRMKSFCQHRKTPVLESVAGAAILSRSRSPVQSIESPRALLPSAVILHNQEMLTTSCWDPACYQKQKVQSYDQHQPLNCFTNRDQQNETDSIRFPFSDFRHF